MAPMVAAKDPKIGFIVLMAGPGAPMADLMAAQRAALAPSMGLSPEKLRASQAMMDQAFAAMTGATDDAEAEGQALVVLPPNPASRRLRRRGPAGRVGSGWMRNIMAYDPRPTLARLTTPVLAINGSKDLQVPPDQNLPAIRAALKANRDATVVELPGLNHLFQTAPTGALGEYAQIEKTVNTASPLDTIANWVVAHTRR